MLEVKMANSNIEALQKALIKQGQAMVSDLERETQEFYKQMERGTLSPMDQDVKSQALQKKQGDIYQFEQKMNNDLGRKREELMEPILKKIQDTIESFSKENGYDYIFDAATGTILFAEEGTDVSDQIKKKLGVKVD